MLTIIGSFFVASNSLVFAADPAPIDIIKPVCDSAGVDKPTVCNDANTVKTTGENPLTGPNGTLTKAINIIATVIAVTSIIIIIISGIKFVLSQGDPQKVATARQSIIYACVGLVVAVVAKAIVQFLLKKLPS